MRDNVRLGRWPGESNAGDTSELGVRTENEKEWRLIGGSHCVVSYGYLEDVFLMNSTLSGVACDTSSDKMPGYVYLIKQRFDHTSRLH